MQEHSFHKEGSDLGGSPKGGEGNPSGQTPMGTPVLHEQMEANRREEIIKDYAKEILRLGNECRVLADENKELKSEVERLGAFRTHTIIPNEILQADNNALKDKVELLERQVNYWRIEAEVDHGRWLRCLEDLERIRNLK